MPTSLPPIPTRSYQILAPAPGSESSGRSTHKCVRWIGDKHGTEALAAKARRHVPNHEVRPSARVLKGKLFRAPDARQEQGPEKGHRRGDQEATRSLTLKE